MHRIPTLFLMSLMLWLGCPHGVVAVDEHSAETVATTDSLSFACLNQLDIERVQELTRLARIFGDDLWAGFDLESIPIAVNCDDREELLFRHPSPPPEYQPFDQRDGNGRAILWREGVSRYGPHGGGWAVDLDGVQTAYVSTLQEDQSTEDYLSTLIHECFHVYQREFWSIGYGPFDPLPEASPEYSAGLALECFILHAALTMPEPDQYHLSLLTQMFIATRNDRRRGLSQAALSSEEWLEFSEGTASYVPARLAELILAHGIGGSDLIALDSSYQGFSQAQEKLDEVLVGILPPHDQLITFMHGRYENGLGQCLLLDQLSPQWKQRMQEEQVGMFSLIREAVPLARDEEQGLLAAAKKRFNYDSIFSAQQKLAEDRIDSIQQYLDRPGRRYRVHHAGLTGFNWDPVGPVLEIPVELLPEGLTGGGRGIGSTGGTIWLGGINTFERDGMTFSSPGVPIVYGFMYVEWIDQNPAPDYGDCRIEYSREDQGTYYRVVVTTDGFTLSADRATISKSDTLVDITVLPPD